MVFRGTCSLLDVISWFVLVVLCFMFPVPAFREREREMFTVWHAHRVSTKHYPRKVMTWGFSSNPSSVLIWYTEETKCCISFGFTTHTHLVPRTNRRVLKFPLVKSRGKQTVKQIRLQIRL